MAEKFTISEVYADESTRIQASNSNPMKDDTLILVSENDGGDYKTKALDYGTLYSSLCTSMNLDGIVNDIQTNHGDALGISGDYPCFFEMHSSELYCTPQQEGTFSITASADKTCSMTGLFSKIWAGNTLCSDVSSDGNLVDMLLNKDGTSLSGNAGLTKTFLSNYICLKPFILFPNQYPDPQLVSIMVSSKQSFGVYVEHKMESSNKSETIWQRMPIFTYNPDTTTDYITSRSFVLAPGSRFGLFGKADFFSAETTIVMTLMNTKGFPEQQNTVLSFTNGSSESTTVDFTTQQSCTYHVFGPITGKASGTISLQMKQGNGDFTTVASKIYSTTKGSYVDFGKVYVKNGMTFRYWNSGKNINTAGTTLIDGKSYINGNLYFVKENNVDIPNMQNVLKLKFKNGRTPTQFIGRNVQLQIVSNNPTTKYIRVGDNGIYHTTSGSSNWRFYQTDLTGTYDVSVDCTSTFNDGCPFRTYVSAAALKLDNEYMSSNNDGMYSGIASIDGSEVSDISQLDAQVAYNCTNLTEVKFGNGLWFVGDQAFEGCSALTKVEMPGLLKISKNAFKDCKSLCAFNQNGDNYSVVPSNTGKINVLGGVVSPSVQTGAFAGVAIKKLSVGTSDDSEGFEKDVFTKMNLDDCKIRYHHVGSNLAFANTKMRNLCIDLGVSYTNKQYLPLMNSTCSVDNLSILGLSENLTLNSNLNYYKPISVYISGIYTLGSKSLLLSKTLNALETVDTNIPNNFCQNCTTVNSVSLTNGTIGESAFSECTGITWLTLSGVTSIGKSAFSGCTGIELVNLPQNLSSIGAKAFYNCTKFVGDGGETSRVRLDGIQSFANDAVFQGTNIKQVQFGEKLTTPIDKNTFKNCKKLTDLFFKHADNSDNRRLIYKILVGNDPATQDLASISADSQIWAGDDTDKTIKVYLNSSDFDENEAFLFAEIKYKSKTQSTITFKKNI